MLFVNYKGSLGNGEDCVNALCGNIGALDVQNVYHAIQIITSKFNIDPSKLLLFGGSHGGFIVTHLIGQYPVKLLISSFNLCSIHLFVCI